MVNTQHTQITVFFVVVDDFNYSNETGTHITTTHIKNQIFEVKKTEQATHAHSQCVSSEEERHVCCPSISLVAHHRLNGYIINMLGLQFTPLIFQEWNPRPASPIVVGDDDQQVYVGHLATKTIRDIHTFPAKSAHHLPLR